MTGVPSAPVRNENVTLPKSVAPSCKWNVAVIVWPHAALAVKVKGRVTAGPLGHHGAVYSAGRWAR